VKKIVGHCILYSDALSQAIQLFIKEMQPLEGLSLFLPKDTSNENPSLWEIIEYVGYTHRGVQSVAIAVIPS
jgi:hypothetical protein